MMFSPPRKRSGFLAESMSPTVTAASLVMFWALLLLARPAVAQDQATIDRLVQLNKKAMDDYDTADFDAAKKSLLDAEKAGKRAGLEGHPVMARTYIHLGALYLMGYKDKPKAQHYFGKALDIQPDIKIDKTLTSPSVRDVFAEVKAQKGEASSAESLFPPSPGKGGGRSGDKNAGKGGARAAAPDVLGTDAGDQPATETTVRRKRLGRAVNPDAEPDLPATITALDCPYPDDTPPGQKVTLRCVAAASLGVSGVALYFKGFEMSDYEKMDMAKSSKGWWQATVPKKRVDGKSLQFYFEGLDAGDKPVVSNGRAESPNVMLIVDRGSQVATAPSGAEVDENPLEESNRTAPRFQLGTRDEKADIDTRYGNRRFWIGIGAGTGMAVAINGTLESRVCGLGDASGKCVGGFPALSHSVKVDGPGWARLAQLVPEIGLQINPDWAISVEGRHQWIPQAKKVADYAASGAHAVLFKILHYTKQKRTRVAYGVLGGGGSGVRMNIQSDAANPELWDTILIGGVLLGGTAALNYEISRSFTWTVGVNGLYGFPHKGLVFDLNTGIQFNFGDTSGAAAAAKKKKVNSVSTSIDDEDPN